MAPAGFQADSGLRRHAGHLHGLSDALREVAVAARQTRIPADAYGRFCQSFPMTLGAVEQAGAAACQQAATATESAATAIKATADAYNRVEHTFVRRAGALE
jgi:hypothetical protein